KCGTLPRAGTEKGEHLYRFAEAHVVGETTAETELPDKMQPTQTFLLIISQLSAKGVGGGGGPNTGETLQLFADAQERGVKTDFGFAGQQRIEKSGLMTSEPEPSFTGMAEAGDEFVPFDPVFRQHANRPVAQWNEILAAR